MNFGHSSDRPNVFGARSPHVKSLIKTIWFFKLRLLGFLTIHSSRNKSAGFELHVMLLRGFLVFR